MLNALRRLLGNTSEPPVSELTPFASMERVPVDMVWQADTWLPIPDWTVLAEREPATGDDGRRHAYWTSAAASWLDAAGHALGPAYRRRESEDFLVLSSLADRQAQPFQTFCQTTLRRIRRNLGELACDAGYGKYVAIVFADEDAYYRYIDHYYPEGGEYAMSSGVFLHAGYGHFALHAGELDAMEPVIAHELTHCLLSHLPIPAWLNEGLAVNTEHAMFPHLADPRARLHFPHEIAAKHAAYWNGDSIQTFWSGKSFLDPEGASLSYDLAEKITALVARDDTAFRAFVSEAHMDDGGVRAERLLGYPLSHLVEAVLGDGEWEPRPDAWKTGVEHGQF